jgi:hypothetical protein
MKKKSSFFKAAHCPAFDYMRNGGNDEYRWSGESYRSVFD